MNNITDITTKNKNINGHSPNRRTQRPKTNKAACCNIKTQQDELKKKKTEQHKNLTDIKNKTKKKRTRENKEKQQKQRKKRKETQKQRNRKRRKRSRNKHNEKPNTTNDYQNKIQQNKGNAQKQK